MTEEPAVSEDVFDKCRGWLRYYSEDWKTYPVKIAQLRDIQVMDGSERVGLYGRSLVDAQFYWALRVQEPFLASAGFARRRFQKSGQVVYFLHQNYQEDWDEWRLRYEERPLRALLDHVAEKMAIRLGDDIL